MNQSPSESPPVLAVKECVFIEAGVEAGHAIDDEDLRIRRRQKLNQKNAADTSEQNVCIDRCWNPRGFARGWRSIRVFRLIIYVKTHSSIQSLHRQTAVRLDHLTRNVSGGGGDHEAYDLGDHLHRAETSERDHREKLLAILGVHLVRHVRLD